MDPITHGALGAACAEALFYKQDKRNAWIVGALAAMAPDLDIFIRSSQDPLMSLVYHRHFTHSLSFIPLGALLVALFLLLFQRFREHRTITFLASLTGFATHGLLDACTNYGTMLLWPFSNMRISWDIVSIINPLVTIPLIIGLFWTWIMQERRGVIIGLGLCGLFLIFNTFQHYRAITVLKSQLAEQNQTLLQYRVFPDLASSFSWRGLVLSNKKVLIYRVKTPFKNSSVLFINAFPRFQSSDLPTFVDHSPDLLRDFYIFSWFTDDYLILVNKDPLLIADGRFLLNDKSNTAIWGLEFLPELDHAKKIHFIPINKS